MSVTTCLLPDGCCLDLMTTTTPGNPVPSVSTTRPLTVAVVAWANRIGRQSPCTSSRAINLEASRLTDMMSSVEAQSITKAQAIPEPSSPHVRTGGKNSEPQPIGMSANLQPN